jgi:hypothetical protein
MLSAAGRKNNLSAGPPRRHCRRKRRQYTTSVKSHVRERDATPSRTRRTAGRRPQLLRLQDLTDWRRVASPPVRPSCVHGRAAPRRGDPRPRGERCCKVQQRDDGVIVQTTETIGGPMLIRLTPGAFQQNISRLRGKCTSYAKTNVTAGPNPPESMSPR